MKSKMAITILALVLITTAGLLFFINRKNGPAAKPKQKQIAAKPVSKKPESPEKWRKNTNILMEGVTSSCTLQLNDKTYRMYLMNEMGISYANSADGKVFGKTKPTGVTQSVGKMISNPSVLEISRDNWIMVYEEQPQKNPGQQQGPPSAATQRNLYLATSSDGMNFKKSGVAIDSSKETEDNYFASVPELVKLPDGKIRMYYVSGGEAIGSAISSDQGKTWKREEGFRLEDYAVDPEILYENGKWIMYYASLPVPDANNKSAIYKATSKDGLIWTKDDNRLIEPKNAGGFVVDPDVVKVGDTYRMFFGGAMGGIGANAQRINLFYADKVK